MAELVPIEKDNYNANTGELMKSSYPIKRNYLNIQQFILKKDFRLQLMFT
jgi:hypothetical protein